MTTAGLDKIPLNPTETESILQGMQRLVDERSGPYSQIMSGLKDASAWTAGGANGPSAALNERDRQKQLEQEDLIKMQGQMATYRNALSQNQAAKQQLQNLIGGAGTIPGAAGTTSQHTALLNDPDVQLRMASLPAWDSQGRLDILADTAKTQFGNKSKGAYEAAGNKPETFPVPGIGPGGKTGLMTMTPNEYLEFKATGRLPDGRVIPQGTTAVAAAAPQVGEAQAPSAATTPAAGTAMDPIAAVRTIESNNNPNVAPSSKGAVGAMQVLPSTARNPGFGVKPIQNDSPEELERLGRDYYSAMQNRYKDPTIAAIAYNWGPGNTDKWLAAGADPSKLPDETKGYVTKFQSLIGGQQAAPVAAKPTPVAAKPAPVVNEWDDNTKMLPGHTAPTINEWDDNTRMLPGQIAPAPTAAPAAAPAPTAVAAPAPTAVAAPAPTAVAAPAPTAVAAPAPTAARIATEAMPTYEGNLPEYNAAVAAWQKRQEERAKGLGTASTKTAEQDTDKKNEYRDSLDTTQKTFDQYDRLLNASKGHADAFNLAGGLVGSTAARLTPTLSSDPSEHHAIARTWFSDKPLYTNFKNIDQGAAEAQAAWAKNLVQGAGGRLTNADLQLGKPAKGVGVETTYESHMSNLAKNMQDIRTAYYRAAEFQKWEKQNPNGTAAQFEMTPYYQTYSKVDAARDVAKKFLDVPEVVGKGNDKYIHKDANGKPYIIVNGQGYSL